MKKKHGWIKIVAISAAVVGGLVAVAAFLKRKGKKIREELEFDDEMYFNEDDDFADDIMNGDATVELEDTDDDEDMVPDESADSVTGEAETAEADSDSEEPKE